jgi:hypothetical protein
LKFIRRKCGKRRKNRKITAGLLEKASAIAGLVEKTEFNLPTMRAFYFKMRNLHLL